MSANVSANVSATCPTTATTTKTQPPVQAQFIGTGSTHACAVSAEHNAVCWGNGDDGKTTTPGATVASITVGLNNACAITLADSTATCWGSNGHQMSSPPVDLGALIAISAGGEHVCAIKADSTAACWGRNGNNQAVPPGDLMAALDAGWYHTCAIKAVDSRAQCWGGNGPGATDVPSNVAGVTAISAGA